MAGIGNLLGSDFLNKVNGVDQIARCCFVVLPCR